MSHPQASGETARNPGRRRLLLAAAGLGVAALPLDAFLLEPEWLQITRHQVPLPGLPADLDGLRIAQLSDLHRGPYIAEETITRAVDACNRLNPDLVVLTGDFISRSPQFAPSCAWALSRLQAPRGVYAVSGNHDHWLGLHAVVQALRQVGIDWLSNMNTRVLPGLRLAGVDDVWAGHADPERALRGHRPGEGLVFLCHSPNILPRLADQNVACVCLTGHTHGGQVCLPLIERRRLPGLLGYPYVAGWYSRGRTRMYVNRGIGMVIFPVRFLCRPELSLFTLCAAPAGA